jgi:hypothetical protein
MENGKIVVICLLFILLIVLAIFGPVFTIWSLNAIFGTQIPVNFTTWAAVSWLIVIFHGIRFQAKKN